jgi:hypothetical protein
VTIARTRLEALLTAAPEDKPSDKPSGKASEPKK